MSVDKKAGGEGGMEARATGETGMGPKAYNEQAARRVAEGRPIVEGAEAMAAKLKTQEPAMLMVPIHEVFALETQMRSKQNEADVQDLVESIRLNGWTSAIIVRRAGEKLEVVAGHRRLRAARELQLDQVPVIIQNQGDEVSRLSTQATENISRKDVNVIETANHALKLLEATGGDQALAARHMNVLQSRMSELLLIARLPDAVKSDMAKRDMGYAMAVTFARLYETYRTNLPKDGKDASTRTVAAMARAQKDGWSAKRLKEYAGREKERLSGLKKARRAGSTTDGGAPDDGDGSATPGSADATATADSGSAGDMGLFRKTEQHLVINLQYLAAGNASGEEKAALAAELQAVYNAMRPRSS